MKQSSLRGRHIAASLVAILAFLALCTFTEDIRPESRGLAAEIERAIR